MVRLGVSFFAAVLAATPLAAETARFQFCWVGANGFTMEGIIGFPDRLLGTGIITERQVTEFRIWGSHNGDPIGDWSMEALTPTTSWTLFYDTTRQAFPMGGHRWEFSYQEWNANGEVNDCGIPGFGFNGGDWAQDVCIDNTWINASSIDPDTPLQVFEMDVTLDCEAVTPTS